MLNNNAGSLEYLSYVKRRTALSVPRTSVSRHRLLSEELQGTEGPCALEQYVAVLARSPVQINIHSTRWFLLLQSS